MCRNQAGIETFLTDKEKEKIKKIQKHLNSGKDVIYGEIEEWTLEDVYLMLLGKAIENYVLEGETE